MRITRRALLQGSSAALLLAGTGAIGFGARPARAAPGPDPLLVLVHLQGGNDALNTVIPTDDVGAPQRTRYEALRPDLALPHDLLGPMALGADPALGTGLALHPALVGLKELYDEGRLAVVLGAGLPTGSLSHFEAEAAWWSGDPFGPAGSGWIGRHLDWTFGGSETRALSFGAEVNPTLAASSSDVIGARSIAEFDLPDDPDERFRDGLARTRALAAIYGEGRPDSLCDRAARAGATLLEKSEVLVEIETTGWGSRNEAERRGLGLALRQIASVVRHDAALPARATGLRFFHVQAGGFDTHSRQGAVETTHGHPRLLDGLSRALTGFQRDLEALGLAHRVVTLVYSEFGRRAAQNGSGSAAGTDHGRGGVLFLLGQPVAGGLFGRLPELDRLDAHGNLAVEVDFRSVYASLIDGWLAGDSTDILPGGPFPQLPLF